MLQPLWLGIMARALKGAGVRRFWHLASSFVSICLLLSVFAYALVCLEDLAATYSPTP